MRTVAPGILLRHRHQWLALAALLLALAAGVGAFLAVERTAQLDDEGERLRAQVRLVDRNLARQLWSTHQTLGELIGRWADWQRSGDLSRAGPWLRALSNIHPGVRTINLLDAGGRVLASNRAELVGRDFHERDYFNVARDGNDPEQLYLSPPFRTDLGVRAVNAVRVVRDAQGGFGGAVTATLDPSYFELLLSSVNFAPDVWSAIVHDSGEVFMMAPERKAMEGRNINVPHSMFARHLASGTDETLFRGLVVATGDRRLIAHHTVRPLGVRVDHALVVAVSRSEAGALAGWHDLAYSAATAYVLVLLISIGGLRWVQHAEREGALRLDETLDRIERIAQTAPGIICQFELHPDGHASMPYTTRPLRPFFGIDSSTVPGSADPMFDYMHPDDVAGMRAAVLESARTMQPYREEFRTQPPGEPERWIAVHSVPQRRPDGGTLWTGLVTDATEQHAAREAQVALESAQRASRAKSEFLSRASHELRTPLNAVIGFASLLLGHPRHPLMPEQREQVGYILTAGQHLLALINDLLDVSSIESGRVTAVIQDVPVAALVTEVVSTLRDQAAAAGVQVAARLDAPQLVARADRVRLKQVLLNLLSNAIKFNHPGGTVTIALSGSAETGVRLDVQDTGSGLSGEQQAHLFEPFNRLGADRRGIAGTGIGLTIAKMLVELMHGRIAVDSEPGTGSRFSVFLPAAAPAARAAGAAEAAPAAALPSADGHALRVLYVEDQPMNALFVQQLLALRPNVRLVLARSGAEALESVQREVPDLMLVDIHLGDLSGFELVERLHAAPATAALRCVALSADALASSAQRAAALGFIDYLTKPVDAGRLLALIDHEALVAAAARAVPAEPLVRA